ncbi:MAG TPA: exonuclease domain-containing protein [Azospirillaceae bacterium]|nr:exonuclease domain-containing protein [Azospirillaceae bacterium]
MTGAAAETETAARGVLPTPNRTPRRLLPLAFAGLGAAGIAAPLAARFVLDFQDMADPLTTVAAIGAFGAGAAVGGVWLAVQRLMVRPGQTLAREARVIAHGGAGAHVPVGRYAELSPIPQAMNELVEKLADARRDIDRAVAVSTATIHAEKTRLAAILNDLHEGVLVCNLKHQVLLYNQTALNLLHLTGDLGLGRSLLTVVQEEQILHTLERLRLRVREGRHRTHAHGTTAQFVGGTTDGRALLEGRMGLIMQDEEITGYVVTFTDVTSELEVLGKRDALLREASEGFRGPIANLSAMLETLSDFPELEKHEREAFETAMVGECAVLTARLEHLTSEYRGIITGHWPMNDIHSHNLINLVINGIPADAPYSVMLTGLPQWLHADSYSLVEMLEFILRKLHETTGVDSFDLSTEAEGPWVYLDIAWTGTPVPSGTLDGWLSERLPATALGGMTVGDVLQHHRSDMWSETWRDSCARLRVPLPPAQTPPSAHARPPATAMPRPEFFDFDLLHQPLDTSELGRTRLDRLTYVVFDTETTGLAPSQGDEIIQIAGVRVVNGRILTGETFSSLINPRRKIPPESVPFHGITNEMVQDKPGIETVLPQFKAFVSGAVLVAHNAAFDLKFLKMKERVTGVRFDNPVLDTMLLSRMLTGEGGDHTLDSIALRLGIQVVDRHTALGDSLVTAAVFLRMIEMLKERGITTLDDAIRSANILVELHQRERAF